MKQDNATQAAGSSEPACSPFKAGCVAYGAGIKVGDNPYNESSEAHWDWMEGWVSAAEAARKMNAANARHEARREKGVT